MELEDIEMADLVPESWQPPGKKATTKGSGDRYIALGGMLVAVLSTRYPAVVPELMAYKKKPS